MATRKRNTPDATIRNVRASKRRDQSLAEQVRTLKRKQQRDAKLIRDLRRDLDERIGSLSINMTADRNEARSRSSVIMRDLAAERARVDSLIERVRTLEGE